MTTSYFDLVMKGDGGKISGDGGGGGGFVGNGVWPRDKSHLIVAIT
jgi:hypothetical protein